MIDKRKLHHLDFYLILNLCAIIGIGILNLISATSSLGSKTFVTKQLFALAIGLGLVMIILYFDYRIIVSNSLYLYILGLSILVLVFFLGASAGGAKRWFAFWGLSFQPSEFMKPILLVFLVKMVEDHLKTGSLLSFGDIVKPTFFTFLPAVTVFLQPDLGTACLLFLLCLSILSFVGMKRSTFISLVLGGVLIGILAWKWGLQPYQKLRILGLLNPDMDPSGFNYHARQAMIAVGSGKFFGKGYLCGTQHKLNFIPEHHTDFIFTVIAEEWGFLGSIVVFLLFGSLIMRCLKISKEASDETGSVLAFGCAALIFWQFSINVLMTLRFCPVVGIPLPFLSYGGSSLVGNLCLIGLVLNVNMRRYMF